MLRHTFSVLPERHATVALAFAPIVVNLSVTAPAPTSMVTITTAAHAVKWYVLSLPFPQLLEADRCCRYTFSVQQDHHARVASAP